MPKRRGHGEGSIRQRTRKRADGSTYEWWEGRVMVGYRPDGRPDVRVVTGKTRQEVVQKLAALPVQKASGRLVAADCMTVGQWLDRWFAHHSRFGGKMARGSAPTRPATTRA